MSLSHRFFHPGSYMAGMAVLLLFTLALFVWLTSTNRFVFFGQDFPFISLRPKGNTLPHLYFMEQVIDARQPGLDRVKINREFLFVHDIASAANSNDHRNEEA